METILQLPPKGTRKQLHWSNLHWHLMGWVLYFVFTFLHNHYRYDDAAEWSMVLIIVAMVLPVYYVIAYILHRYIRKGTWAQGLLMLLGLFPLACGYSYLCLYPGFKAAGIHWPIHDMRFDLFVFSMAIGIYYARILLYAMMFEAVKRAFGHFNDKLRIANQHAATLNALLRFQINGHFQYNMLNFVAISAAERGDKREHQMIIELSNLQRYCMEIAESRLTLVDIRREIGALRDLVALAVATQDNEQVMTLDVTGTYMGQYVPPAALLTVADNMLKYGWLTAANPGTLSLELLPDGFAFTARNRIDREKLALRKGAGMGLKNLEKRLQLLFPNQYRLTREVQNDYHTLFLSVNYANVGKNT